MNRLSILTSLSSRWCSPFTHLQNSHLRHVHSRLNQLTTSTQQCPSLRHKSFSTKAQRPPRPPRGGRSAAHAEEIRKRNNSLMAWSLAIVLGTIGLSYASVPLYRVFCQVTGFGGTVRTIRRVDNTKKIKKEGTGEEDDDDDDDDDDFMVDENRIVPGRPITIRFNADVSARVPWKFTPQQSQVVVLPGETALAFYLAENKSTEAVTGIATYNITPAKAAIYFNKVQCFCFDEQRLKPGEKLDMPVFFFIDPDFADDGDMDDIKDIMLSYTFFKAEDVTPEQLVKAQAIAMGHS